jgi:hypothetical protein
MGEMRKPVSKRPPRYYFYIKKAFEEAGQITDQSLLPETDWGFVANWNLRVLGKLDHL